MTLHNSDAVDIQMGKMLSAINEKVRLTNEELIPIGKTLNGAKVAYIMDNTKENKARVQEIKGAYKEIEVKLDVQKEIINGLKVAIKMEASQI